MWPYRIDASPLRAFRPLDDTPPFSVAEDINPTAPLQALLLDCSDPRCVLYTLYYDEKEGK